MDLNADDSSDDGVEICVSNLPPRSDLDESEAEIQEVVQGKQLASTSKKAATKKPRSERTVKHEKGFTEISWDGPEAIKKLFGRNYCSPEIIRVRRAGFSTKWYRIERGITAAYDGRLLRFTDLRIECFDSFINDRGKMYREKPDYKRPLHVLSKRKRADPHMPT